VGLGVTHYFVQFYNVVLNTTQYISGYLLRVFLMKCIVRRDAISGTEVMGLSFSRPAGIVDTSMNSAALQYEQQGSLLNELSTKCPSSLHHSQSRRTQNTISGQNSVISWHGVRSNWIHFVKSQDIF
jgi:hypothetical protein